MTSHTHSSNTWWVFITLYLIYFLFRYNLIYSVTTSNPCRSITDYWLASDGKTASIFSLFLVIFLLVAAWSAIELITAITEHKRDKPVAVAVNSVILVFLVYLFYGMSKQWEYFEIQNDLQNHAGMYQKPSADSYAAEELFRRYLAQKRCAGEIPVRWPDTEDEYRNLHIQFIEDGWVKKAPYTRLPADTPTERTNQ